MNMTTPATAFRLTRADLQALDAIAADMRANRTEALRKLVYEEVERSGLLHEANAALVARLADRYGPDGVIVVETNAGATPEGATVTINGKTPTDARAVLLADDGTLRIEESDGPGSIMVATTVIGWPGELRWEGTPAQLASIVPVPRDSA
jgi:hypothetical protein